MTHKIRQDFDNKPDFDKVRAFVIWVLGSAIASLGAAELWGGGGFAMVCGLCVVSLAQFGV